MPQAAPVLATEAAVATTMTAEAIAAAEALKAAQALEAAQALQATQAAQATATAANAATNQSVLNAIGAGGGAPVSAAQLGGYGGLNSLGAGAGVGTGGISTLGAGAGTGANLGYETLAKEVSGIEQITKVFQNAQANNVPMSGPEFLNQSFAGPAVNTGSQLSPLTPGFTPPIPVAPPAVPNAVVPDPMTYFDPAQPFANPTFASAPPAAPPAPPAVPTMTPPAPPAAPALPAAPTSVNSLPQERMLNFEMNTQGMKAPLDKTATYNLTGSGAQSAAKPGMVEEFMNMSLPNKLLTGMMGATGYEMLNRPKPYEKEKYKSTFKPGLYSGYTPVQPTPYQPRYAVGGIADLGGYSDGGRMLKGPGDGMSDDIPATIANKQPARLANEEFVIPADVVSHLGNGSSEAGAKVLYKMMERVRKARTGNKKQGKQINPDKYLA